MANTNQQNLRKWAALIWALLLYFIIHEGIRMLYALCVGASVHVSFVSLQYEAVVDIKTMTTFQKCVFGLIGSVYTTVAGYIMFLLTDKILQSHKQWMHVFNYYLTIVLQGIVPCLFWNSVAYDGGRIYGRYQNCDE